MSKNVEENKTFLKLFFNTTNLQQKALLYSLTDAQVRVLKEIIFNLRKNFQLPRKFARTLKRRSIQKLSRSSLSLTQARLLIKANYKDITALLMSVRSELEELLL